MSKIKIAITDDHPMVLEGLKTMLNDESCKVIGTYSTGVELLNHIKNDAPDILLLDINLPDINGMELCKKLKKRTPEIKIIALSNFEEVSFVKRMLQNGADGYLLKNTNKQTLLRAFHNVLSGKTYIQRELEHKMDYNTSNRPSNIVAVKLTRREKEVLKAIADELTTDEISEALFISSKTVETHRANIMSKLGAKNSVGMIKTAIENGLI